MVQQALRGTDWAAIDAQTDEDIARNVADDPDAAPILSEAETASAIARAVRKRLGISQSRILRSLPCADRNAARLGAEQEATRRAGLGVLTRDCSGTWGSGAAASARGGIKIFCTIPERGASQ
jgi:hypothetical protein